MCIIGVPLQTTKRGTLGLRLLVIIESKSRGWRKSFPPAKKLFLQSFVVCSSVFCVCLIQQMAACAVRSGQRRYHNAAVGLEEKTHCSQHYCPDAPLGRVHRIDDEWQAYSHRSAQERGGHCRTCHAGLLVVRDMDKVALADSTRGYLGCLDRPGSTLTETHRLGWLD